MAWDYSISPRRRHENDVSSQQPAVAYPPSAAATPPNPKPKSAHVADPALHPFLDLSFDPANYLNTALPPLQSLGRPQPNGTAALLADLSTQTQTLLSNLSAHSTRLTTTLTQLTDEILRSGSRLAYEVEVLRGETLGLSEALTERLQPDVEKFVPGGLEPDFTQTQPDADESRVRVSRAPPLKSSEEEAQSAATADPSYIAQLRTLTVVRSRLDTVIKTFGDAIDWTFPPSEVSVSSSFLSVSAPDPGSEQHSTEERGQQVSKKLRDGVADLLNGDDPVDAIEAAARRVEDLKDLAEVWKGTAEEKARGKFVDSLAKMVEDSHKILLREAEKDPVLRQRVETLQREAQIKESKPQSGFGFISHLQKLRGDS